MERDQGDGSNTTQLPEDRMARPAGETEDTGGLEQLAVLMIVTWVGSQPRTR